MRNLKSKQGVQTPQLIKWINLPSFVQRSFDEDQHVQLPSAEAVQITRNYLSAYNTLYYELIPTA